MSNNCANQEIKTFRRILPQFLAATAKNFIIFNLGEFTAFSAIVIPSLLGRAAQLNPDEMVRVTGAQTSWLATFSYIAQPIGALLSGPLSDRIGRRKTLLILTIPLTVTWISLGFAQSFPLICVGFTLIGFCMGLKETPAITYVSEISEPSIRGAMITMALLSHQTGFLVVFGFGTIFSWRQVAFICALFPFSCFITVLFVPESPSWLLSQNKINEAKTSLQWLRGWTTPQTIQKEFAELQNYCNESTACTACAKQSIKCEHPKPTFCDKMKELKRKRSLKPVLLVFLLYFFFEFCITTVLQPYIILVIRAYGIQMDANAVTVIIAVMGITSSIFLITTVKKLGRRPLYFASSVIVIGCCIALSIYGFIFFPSGWTSFQKEQPLQYEHIQNAVGNYGYLALALMLFMQFGARFGIFGLPQTFLGEVFPLKSRTFLSGIAAASHYVTATFSVKTYYNVEMWLSLPGAMLFYGIIGLIGLILFYCILPETEGRSLEQIELHYSDNSKKITDIYIPKDQNQIKSNGYNNNGQTVSD